MNFSENNLPFFKSVLDELNENVNNGDDIFGELPSIQNNLIYISPPEIQFNPYASNLSQVDDTVITSINLSFKDIATRLSTFIDRLPPIRTDKNALVQNLLRRIFSNYVNDWENLVDRDNIYIGDSYGLRLTLVNNDGTVLQDVETFCKDVKNNVNGIGKNNNYCIQMLDYSEKYASGNMAMKDNFSNFDLRALINKPVISSKTLKVSSTTLPTTQLGQSKLVYENLNRQEPVVNTVKRCQLLDNHGSRSEIQLSRVGGFGLAARQSDTTSHFNWHVCTTMMLANLGTSLSLRMSVIEFSDTDDFPVPTQNPTSFGLTAEQKAYLISRYSS